MQANRGREWVQGLSAGKISRWSFRSAVFLVSLSLIGAVAPADGPKVQISGDVSRVQLRQVNSQAPLPDNLFHRLVHGSEEYIAVIDLIVGDPEVRWVGYGAFLLEEGSASFKLERFVETTVRPLAEGGYEADTRDSAGRLVDQTQLVKPASGCGSNCPAVAGGAAASSIIFCAAVIGASSGLGQPWVGVGLCAVYSGGTTTVATKYCETEEACPPPPDPGGDPGNTSGCVRITDAGVMIAPPGSTDCNPGGTPGEAHISATTPAGKAHLNVYYSVPDREVSVNHKVTPGWHEPSETKATFNYTEYCNPEKPAVDAHVGVRPDGPSNPVNVKANVDPEGVEECLS